MSRLLAVAIGKRYDLNELEGAETPAIKRDDYLYKVAIIFDSVVLYSQYNPNPEVPYYKHTGPMTKVLLSNDEELMILMKFEVFDEAYFKHYTEKTIMIKPN